MSRHELLDVIEAPWRIVDEHSPAHGVRYKDTYQVYDGAQLGAAKIYRLKESESAQAPQLRHLRAVNECEAYQYYGQTPLGQFVPEFYQQVYEGDFAIGLIVEWRNGVPLNGFDFFQGTDPNIQIDKSTLIDLENGLLMQPDEFKIAPDCFAPSNLHWGEGKLWLAECEIGTTTSNAAYTCLVHQTIRDLSRYVTNA